MAYGQKPPRPCWSVSNGLGLTKNLREPEEREVRRIHCWATRVNRRLEAAKMLGLWGRIRLAQTWVITPSSEAAALFLDRGLKHPAYLLMTSQGTSTRNRPGGKGNGPLHCWRGANGWEPPTGDYGVTWPPLVRLGPTAINGSRGRSRTAGGQLMRLA